MMFGDIGRLMESMPQVLTQAAELQQLLTDIRRILAITAIVAAGHPITEAETIWLNGIADAGGATAPEQTTGG